MATNSRTNNVLNFSPIPLSSVDENKADNQSSAWSMSRAPVSIPYEVPNTTSYETKLPPLVSSSSIASNHNQLHRHPSATGPYERQLSLIDPLSDRVSTILVWKNLTVLTREDKAKECFKRSKFWRKFTPKRQRLLNNISGAITGGLWAVMGKFVSVTHLSIYLIVNYRSIGFW